MNNSLALEYVKFVEEGGRIEVFVQEIIDRCQYHPGYMAFLQALNTEYDSPFEWVHTDEHGRVRQIKQSFLKKETDEAINSESTTGNKEDVSI